ISNKNQLPILMNILLQAKQDELILSSTDLEIGIQTTIKTPISEPGEVTIPARIFTELVNSLSGEIILETKETQLLVNSKKSKSKLSTIPATEFPRLYEQKGTLLASVQQADLKQELGSVIFSASYDTARPALSGVLVQQEAQGFLLVATDGY
ncbi:hypothetical protein EF908_05870, partial [Streptomyces sp. WAC04770]